LLMEEFVYCSRKAIRASVSVVRERKGGSLFVVALLGLIWLFSL